MGRAKTFLNGKQIGFRRVTIRAEGYSPVTFDGLDTAACPNLGDVALTRI